MAAVRRASAVWQGDLMSGTGTVSASSSGAFRDLAVSWAARTEEPNGKTSPEELVAAAHAACFSMALSNGLKTAGHAAERLDVQAEVTFDRADGGWKVVSSKLTVRGRVPGMDEATFRQSAEQAKDGCPISKALTGNVQLSVDAQLEG